MISCPSCYTEGIATTLNLRVSHKCSHLLQISLVSEVGLLEELELVGDEVGLILEDLGSVGGLLELLEGAVDVADVLLHLARGLVHQMAEPGKGRAGKE